MFKKKLSHDPSVWLMFAAMILPANLLAAYNGGETFLHYVKVPDAMAAKYQAVCKSLVLSDANSDTLKNARAEFDLAMPKMLGALLPLGDGAGAIVLAAQGSEPVTAASIDYSKVEDEGFIIKTVGGKTYITGKNQVGVLRGTFHFLRLMQMGKDISNLDVVENPYYAYRVLDHWYNHYKSEYEADRLYGGHRVFNMEDFGKLKEIPDEYTRVITYCRMAAALGLNGITPDCVNTYQGGKNKNHQCLEVSRLKEQKVFADIIGTYGLKYYMSVSYASPKLINPIMPSSDAYKNKDVKKWWFDKVDTIRVYIKNFGGFLMKADSEGEDGPRSTWGETQSQGANPIAEALGRYGLIVVWRTFIYGTSDPDFAVNQGKEFAKPVQTWDSAVVIRMKDGTHDFQPIEPPHQLLAMGGARLGMEFQITQEYTGQGVHLDWLVPRWKQTLDWDIKGASSWNGAPGTKTYQILKGAGSRKGGVWAISNLSDTVNWTAHFFAQANYYGWGRLAWNPTLSADQIADEWIRCSFDNGNNPIVQQVVKHMLMRSWPAYKDYVISHNASMSQIGNNAHYEVNFKGMHDIEYFNEWLMNFTSNGIGVERCGKSTGGSVSNNFANEYLTSQVAATFSDPANCPEDYMLFFHHYKWEWAMKGGMTLIQQLQFEHFNGIHQVQKFIKYWKQLNTSKFYSPLIDETIYTHVLSKLNNQLKDGSKWADNFRNDFGTGVYTKQVPCHIDILSPDTTKAVEVAENTKVDLSARLRTQGGTAVSDGTFNWSVEGTGATLSATSGVTTSFTASAPGIYNVKVWDSRWPNQFEDELIFVGTVIGTQKVREMVVPTYLKVFQAPRGIMINSSIAGKVRFVNLQGQTVQSMTMEKPGSIVLETSGLARGFYMVQVTNGTQSLWRHGIFVQ